MRISEVANILGLKPKEVIQEVEELRPKLTEEGFKLAKRLTASSGLDDDAVRLLMAEIDTRRRERKRQEDEAEEKAKREEEERRRKAEAEARAREEEVRRQQAEEARRRADEELERRRRELAKIGETPKPQGAPAPPPPPPVVPGAKDRQPAPPPRPVQQAQPSAPAAKALPPEKQALKEVRRAEERPAAAQPAARRDDPAKKKSRTASADSLQDFVEGGMGPSVKDDYRPRRRQDDRKGKQPSTTESDESARKKKRSGEKRERHHFRPTQIFEPEAPRRRPAPKARSQRGRSHHDRGRQQQETPRVVELRGDFTVGQFAEKLGMDSSEIIKRLMLAGEMRNINQVLDPDLAELIASDLGVEVIIQRESDESDVEKFLDLEIDETRLQLRPPVVTVMGHVDHGKTTLLDSIRNAHVVDSEAGGITQHIGAYYVTTDRGDIVFLDTPGHEAFTAMRARGANVTDLVILVVAANDGVKPQTIEALNHAKAAGVPIIVAINKIDLEGANSSRVKNELMRFDLISEDLGGDTIMVEVSAKAGTNVQDLLEMIALQAEVLELKADPERSAIGTIIESHIDPNRGAVATVLVNQGTLYPGDIFVCGTESGRVRAMRDDRGELLEKAGPAVPVEIIGLTGAPGAGEQFVVVPDEATARDIADTRLARRKMRAAKAKPHITLDTLSDHAEEGVVQSLNLILKADVQGSVEAIDASLMKIESDKVILSILHSGVGAVTEGDVQLADASDAIVIGFNVRPDPVARDLAQRTGVQIRTYNIIYELLEEIEAAMLGMLEPVYEEVPMSRSVVKQVFRIHKVGNVAGVFVEEGTVAPSHKARLIREGTVIWNGNVSSLRRHKDMAKEVVSGLECGIGLENYNDIKDGDVIETYVLKEMAASLVSAGAGQDKK